MQNELIEQFTQYNKKELYQWLIVSMIHPLNQKFGIRYELLIHTLIAISEDKFSNKILTKKAFEEIISWFEKEYSNNFIMMEDFETFKQIKLIPLFLDGKKYHFFYGSIERPYEFLKQFNEIIFSIDVEELNNIKSEFLFSLQRQTDILTEITRDNEAQFETTSMYIPTFDFFYKYKLYFEVEKTNLNYLHNSQKLPPLTEVEKMFDFGIDSNISNTNIPKLDIELEDSISFYEMGMNNFNGLFFWGHYIKTIGYFLPHFSSNLSNSISAANATSVNCFIKEPKAPFLPPILLPALSSLANYSTSVSIFIRASLSICYFTQLTQIFERFPVPIIIFQPCPKIHH
ncbi:MAG: hypothetical protein JJV94_05960 [Sulfurospirillum sp.]|nr:hypothetical protein [Sulfurospirillum sp.]